MIDIHVVTLYVGTERRTLVWTPELAAHWATVARLALPVVGVTPTPVPMIWVDGAEQPGLESLMRLALQRATWEASSLWLTLLTADGRLAETILSLAVSRPMAYPLVIHFQLARHRSLLAQLASEGVFHLTLEATGLVIPFLSVGTAGLAAHLAAAAALSQDTPDLPTL